MAFLGVSSRVWLIVDNQCTSTVVIIFCLLHLVSSFSLSDPKDSFPLTNCLFSFKLLLELVVMLRMMLKILLRQLLQTLLLLHYSFLVSAMKLLFDDCFTQEGERLSWDASTA